MVEIKIDAEATFADLHRLILADCGYQEIDGQKFLLCDEDWRVEKQVCMRDADARSEEDVYLMEHTVIGELMDDEGRRHGKAPLQSMQDEDEAAPAANAAGAESGESFYGEDGFEDEELDLEGFEISE